MVYHPSKAGLALNPLSLPTLPDAANKASFPKHVRTGHMSVVG